MGGFFKGILSFQFILNYSHSAFTHSLPSEKFHWGQGGTEKLDGSNPHSLG